MLVSIYSILIVGPGHFSEAYLAIKNYYLTQKTVYLEYWFALSSCSLFENTEKHDNSYASISLLNEWELLLKVILIQKYAAEYLQLTN